MKPHPSLQDSMPRDKVYFLSDLHLGAPYLAKSKEAERRVVSFLDYIKDTAREIYLLGDILDYWYEYRYVVPRGFVRFFGKLAQLSDSGIRIVWIIGNHDIWINDYIPGELGIEVIDGVVRKKIMGKSFYLAHGDGLGITSRKFRFIRSLFRNKIAQKLYSGIHPRWTIPFAYAWSAQSRKKGESEKPELQRQPITYEPTEFFGYLFDYSQDVLKSEPDINYFIYGHLHIVARRPLSPTSEIIILGEWIRTFSFAVFDGEHLELQRWDDGKVIPIDLPSD